MNGRAEALQIREHELQKRRYLVTRMRADGDSMRRIAERLAVSLGFVHKWCHSKGIQHIRGAVRKPSTQGKIERFHRNVLDRASLPPKGSPVEDYQASMNRYLEFYNLERPHWALDLLTPIEVYAADFKNTDSFVSLGVHEVP
jgi:transposase InsO family protein